MIRKILDYVFASPITAVSSIVIISCVIVLSSRITFETTDTGSNQGVLKSTSERQIGGSENHQDINQSYRENKVTNTGVINSGAINSEVNNAAEKDSNHFNSASKNTKRTGYDYANSKRRNSTDKINNQTSIDYPNEFVDSSYSDFTDSATNNSESSQSHININTSFGASGIANTTNNVTNIANGATNTSTSNNVTKTTDDGVDTTESDILYPTTAEHTVQIDLDETQTISCRRIVENGPPCLCTLTTIDASGTAEQEMNNCGK